MNTIEFLPADYKPYKKSSGYMSFAQGENKFRILSKPITGVEEWIDKKPKRTRDVDNFEPDPKGEQAPKEFMSCIVYNYTSKSIEILNLTQQSIIKPIKTLSSDADWGAPYFYDIKVTKSGSGKEDTKYLVSPLPHKQISNEIIALFNKKPINLEALYTNDDPFSHLQDSYTPGIFKRDAEIELHPVQEVMLIANTINKAQEDELTRVLAQCEEGYKKKVWNFWKKEYGIDKLADLPSKQFEAILKGALNHLFDIATKEEANASSKAD